MSFVPRRIVLTELDEQLLQGATSGNLSEVQHALDEGANVNAKDEVERSVLTRAVINGHREVIRLLLERKANVNAVAGFGDTALYHAARKGYKEIGEMLVDAGADVNKENIWRGVPLHAAAKKGHKEAMEILLDAGADVDKRTRYGNTPLHLAVEHGHRAVVEVLLNHGAIPTRRTMEGKTAHDLAKSDEIRKLLEQPPIVNTKAHPPSRTASRPASRPLETNATRKSVCEYFTAHISFSARSGRQPLPFCPVHDLIYPDTNEKREKIKGLVAKSGTSADEDAWTWIHLPANNIRWVKDLFDALSAMERFNTIDCEKIRKFVDKSFYEHEGSSPQACFRKPSFEKLDKMSNIFSVVMPYIDMETEAYINRKDMMNRAKDRQMDDSEKHFKQMEDLEMTYVTSKEVHVSRTLDQSYYAALEDQMAKALDQVVYRYTKDIAQKEHNKLNKTSNSRRREGAKEFQQKEGRTAQERQLEQSTATETFDGRGAEDESPDMNRPGDLSKRQRQAKILMVNQLWLWKLDARTVITAFPQRWSRGGEDTLLEWILESQFHVESLASVDDLIRHLLQQTITSIEEPYKSGLDEDCFDIFQRSIAKVENEAAKYHTKFANALRSHYGQSQATMSKAVTNYDTEDDNDTAKEAYTAKDADIAKATDIANEMAHLTEIRDIRDEIHMIARVLEDQQDVLRKIRQRLRVDQKLWVETQQEGLNEMYLTLSSDHELSIGMDGLLEEQKFRIERLIRLDENAERVETSLQHLLDLQQKQITIQMAGDTERQSTVLMIFTVITVIFAPLAFLVGLLAVKVDSFPEQWNSWIVAVALIGGEIVALSLVFFGWYSYRKYSPHFKNHLWSHSGKGEKITKGERSGSTIPSGATSQANERRGKRYSSSLRERRKVVVQDPSERV